MTKLSYCALVHLGISSGYPLVGAGSALGSLFSLEYSTLDSVTANNQLPGAVGACPDVTVHDWQDWRHSLSS